MNNFKPAPLKSTPPVPPSRHVGGPALSFDDRMAIFDRSAKAQRMLTAVSRRETLLIGVSGAGGFLWLLEKIKARQFAILGECTSQLRDYYAPEVAA